MNINLVVLLLCSVLLCACAHDGQKPEAFGVTPSEVNAAQSIEDNQRIELRGYLIHESESYGVWDSREAMNAGKVSACLSLLYPARIKEDVIKANRKLVRIVGTFRSNVASNSGVRLGLCNYAGVFVEALEMER